MKKKSILVSTRTCIGEELKELECACLATAKHLIDTNGEIFLVRNVGKGCVFERRAEKIFYAAHATEADIILLPGDREGNLIAGLVAARLGYALLEDANEVFSDGRYLSVVRPSDQKAERIIYHIPAEARMVLTMKTSAPENQPDIFYTQLDEYLEGVPNVTEYPKLLHYTEENDTLISTITSSRVLVGGGDGVKHDDFTELEELAQLLGGVIAVSRPPVDRGWYSREIQIGLSGQTVRPALYIAIGISGAFQHTIGLEGDGFVVAINIDRNARIFDIADIGMVADYREVLPLFISKLKERKSHGVN